MPRIATNGVELDVTTAGPPDGPMVLMLHGFPECAYGWHRQVGPLADAGYFVVVPDQRGYAGSDKPPRVRDYRADRLAADAIGLIDAFGRGRAHVVGHDWGGLVGWTVALDAPERVETFTVMNVPHPAVLASRILVPPQLLRSWYAFAFQVPRLPERALSKDDHARLARVLRSSSRAFDDADLAAYRRCWREPGAVRGMLAWYRAAFRHPYLPRNRRVRVPTLIVWGRHDTALGFELVRPSAARCDDVRIEVIEDAGHFVQHDAPDRVNALLAGFIGPRIGSGTTGRREDAWRPTGS